MDNQTITGAPAGPELGERDVSRREAVRSSGLLGLGLAAAAVPVALGAWASRALAQGGGLPNRIINALNVAYILENLEADYYRLALETPGLIPSSDRAVFAQISKHETAHVAFLKSVLGGRAARLPTFDFTAGGALATYSDYETFLLVAQSFEDFGVRAYKGQAGNLMGNDAVLTAALQIHSVEARHASEVRRIRGRKGWITGDDGAPATLPLSVVYGGEQNVTHLGVDVSKYEGPDAATEAFDEPVTNLHDVLRVVGVFTRK